jgi:hypothetical protein
MILCGVLAIFVLLAAVVLIRKQQRFGKPVPGCSVLLFVAAVFLRPDVDSSDNLDATRLEAELPN